MPKCFLAKDTKQLDKTIALLAGYRRLRGLSQKQLAEEINVSQQTVSNWETKDTPITVENLLEVCKVLKVKPSDMFE